MNKNSKETSKLYPGTPILINKIHNFYNYRYNNSTLPNLHFKKYKKFSI